MIKLSEKYEYAYFDEDKIFGFFGKYRFLSNFHRCSVSYDTHIWPSTEHAYMAAKCASVGRDIDGISYRYQDLSVEDIKAMSCAEVRRWGQTVELRDDWEGVKVPIMLQINIDKYLRNVDLRRALIDTGDRHLVEANNWGDKFWGFDVKKNKGKNYLGTVLMTVRGVLKTNLPYPKTYNLDGHINK